MRLAYRKPQPLLGWRERMDSRFFGRLLDQLANAHAALVRIYQSEGTARDFACLLRKELPGDVYEVSVLPDHDNNGVVDWNVMVYNRITYDMRKPPIEAARGSFWIDMKEAARVLKISPETARKLVIKYELTQRRIGGANKLFMLQKDLVILANRPLRWGASKRRVKVRVE